MFSFQNNRQGKFSQFIFPIFLILTLNYQSAFAGIHDGTTPNVQQATQSSSDLDEQTKPPLRHFQDCDVCSEMVVLPAGEYMMGATPDDLAMMREMSHSIVDTFVTNGVYAQEIPRHLVQVKSFAIAKFDVTRGQFAVFAKENPF